MALPPYVVFSDLQHWLIWHARSSADFLRYGEMLAVNGPAGPAKTDEVRRPIPRFDSRTHHNTRLITEVINGIWFTRVIFSRRRALIGDNTELWLRLLPWNWRTPSELAISYVVEEAVDVQMAHHAGGFWRVSDVLKSEHYSESVVESLAQRRAVKSSII